MPTYQYGRHEHGQNFLVDHAVIRDILSAVSATDGPIIEIGPGSGALTLPLSTLKRPTTAVEIDPALARNLSRRTPDGVDVVCADFLRYRLPQEPHVLVGNLPFHLTTALLRRILHAPAWSDAILVVQWEVARRRAGVGGATMMTAQWWPWFTFAVRGRVSARAFRPRPNVDGGLLTVTRRHEPLIPWTCRREYQQMVHTVFTASGRGLDQILSRSGLIAPAAAAHRFLARHGHVRGSLPRDLGAEQWADLFRESSRVRR